jgi:hypothetical protein
MADFLRERIRAAAERPTPAPELKRVQQRARVIRVRRLGSVAVAAVVLGVALAFPLYSLRHFGEATHPRPVSATTFGDGSVSFAPSLGWSTLRGGSISACETTASFASADVQQAQNLGRNDVLGCRATAAALPADGVLVTASASDAYSWAQPNANFPASSLPPTLDPSTCGAGAYEGQPAGTSECHVWITANHRQLDITVWFGTTRLGSDLIGEAQRGLDVLRVSEPANLGNDIAFIPSAGWDDQAVTPTAAGPAYAMPVAWTSNVKLKPYSGVYYPAGPSNADIEGLPPEGIIVEAHQWISTRNPLPETGDFQPLSLPLHLSDGRLIVGGGEGLATNDVSQLYLRGVVNGRPMIVQALFGTREPDSGLIRQAQTALDRLVVVPAPPTTTALNDFGISIRLPSGWHGWLYAGDPTLVATTSDATTPFTNDVGAPGVGQQMGMSDTTIVLDESDTLQDLRWPAISGSPQIGPTVRCDGCEVMDDGRPPADGHVLYRDTFTSGGRAFDLYVEFGSSPSAEHVDHVNAILATLELTPNGTPQPTPEGDIAVGSLPDGQRPAVTPADHDRTLSWSYAGRASIFVPAGWTGWTNLVVDSGEPLNLFALGSWDVPQGAYCAPITALQQLPDDGVLIWIDRYAQAAGAVRSGAEVWPISPAVGPGTSPAPAPTDCTGGVPVQSFLWTSRGRTFAVHVAYGSSVTDATIRAAERSLASFSNGR